MRKEEPGCDLFSGFLTVEEGWIILTPMKAGSAPDAPREAGGRSETARGALRTWSLPALWSIGIFYFSSLPGGAIFLPSFRLADKLIHFFVYAVLNVLVLRGCRKYEPAGRAFTLGMLYSILFGLTDEFHQYFVPGRFADPLDFAANSAGILVSGWLYIRFVAGRGG
jgi:hypothetical protein